MFIKTLVYIPTKRKAGNFKKVFSTITLRPAEMKKILGRIESLSINVGEVG